MLRSVEIVEVSPRDGLQNEATPFTTVQKVALIELAVTAGASRIEVASVVRAGGRGGDDRAQRACGPHLRRICSTIRIRGSRDTCGGGFATMGRFPMQNSFPRLTDTPGSIRSLAPAAVGADNERVSRDILGITDDELQRLRDAGIT